MLEHAITQLVINQWRFMAYEEEGSEREDRIIYNKK